MMSVHALICVMLVVRARVCAVLLCSPASASVVAASVGPTVIGYWLRGSAVLLVTLVVYFGVYPVVCFTGVLCAGLLLFAYPCVLDVIVITYFIVVLFTGLATVYAVIIGILLVAACGTVWMMSVHACAAVVVLVVSNAGGTSACACWSTGYDRSVKHRAAATGLSSP